MFQVRITSDVDDNKKATSTTDGNGNTTETEDTRPVIQEKTIVVQDNPEVSILQTIHWALSLACVGASGGLGPP